jgi:neutral ceramidase
MRIGTAKIDITPVLPIELCGFIARVQPATDIHDRLWASCILLEDDSQKLLWINCDLIAFEGSFTQKLRLTLSKCLDIDSTHILLTATHTHSGPATIHLTNSGEVNDAYMSSLFARLVEVAEKSSHNMQPAQCVSAIGLCRLGVDRRKPDHPFTDESLGVIAWRAENEKYIAVWANYAMHNVGLGPANRCISGDITGLAAQNIAQTLPGNPVVLFTNGACGNIDPPAINCTFERIETWASMLANTVSSALNNAQHIPLPSIRLITDAVQIPLEEFSADRIESAARTLDDQQFGEEEFIFARCRDAAQKWKISQLEMLAAGTQLKAINVELTALSLGPVRLLLLGAEVFSEFTDHLRTACPGHLFVVGYANDDIGYIPAEYAYEMGGYEVENAFIFYNSLLPRRDAMPRLLDKSLKMIKILDQNI